MVQQDLKVNKDQLDKTELMEVRVFKVTQVPQVYKDFKANRVFKEFRVTREFRVFKVSRVFKEIQVLQDQMAMTGNF
jgi:hypothetical protein